MIFAIVMLNLIALVIGVCVGAVWGLVKGFILD